jgi:hypothetical protein
MPRLTDLLRDHAYSSAVQYGGVRTIDHPDLDRLTKIRWVPEFETLMRNRLIMGSFRHECDDLWGPPSRVFDNLPSIRARLDHFERTGDIEDLVDVANLCMIEFRYTRHPARHMGTGGEHEMHARPID